MPPPPLHSMFNMFNTSSGLRGLNTVPLYGATPGVEANVTPVFCPATNTEPRLHENKQNCQKFVHNVNVVSGVQVCYELSPICFALLSLLHNTNGSRKVVNEKQYIKLTVRMKIYSVFYFFIYNMGENPRKWPFFLNDLWVKSLLSHLPDLEIPIIDGCWRVDVPIIIKIDLFETNYTVY